ncbi:MAG: mechanosensitive ion channel domain-containing protein [Pseudomonadota bacterium]
MIPSPLIPRLSSAIPPPMFNEAVPTQSVIDWTLANREGLLAGGLVAVGIVAVMLALRAFGQKMVAGENEGEHLGWKHVIGRVFARTTIFFMVIVAIELVTTYAAPPARAQRVVDVFFTIAFALQAAIWIRELILAMIARRVGDDPGATTLGNAMGLIRVLVSVAAFAIAIVVILDNLGVNVTALVAGLGIGGIAIGLAAQGIFSDLFAALAIVFDKPFRRGDTIRYGGAAGSVGTVEKIGLKTTRIRSISGEQLIMANTKLLEQELTNVDDSRVRRTWLAFGLTYQVEPDVIERLPEILQEAIKPIKSCRLVRATAKQFGPSSIDCDLVYDDRSTDADALAKHKSAIIVAIMRIFARDKIDFAYPTQTTFTAAPDGSMIMPYASVQPVVRVDQDNKKRD